MSKFKLPSPKTTAFVAALGVIVGIKKYDNYRSEQVRNQLKEAASVKAKEPLGPFEMPTKVIVYLSPPPGDGIHKSRIYFRDYVKPIFDAGALDYDIYEAHQTGDIHATVCTELVNRRRDLIPSPKDDPLTSEQPLDAPAAASQVQKVDPATCPKIAIGRNTLVEIYNGLSEGATASLNPPPPPPPTDFLATPSPSDPLSASASPSPSPAVPAVDYDSLDTGVLPPIPPIGFVNFKNRIGWSSIPSRILRFFYDTPQVEKIGQQALNIVLERRRVFQPSDLELGTDDDRVHALTPEQQIPLIVEPRILTDLVVYDLPKPPPGTENL
ncbi:inner membrane protein import complex subunit Tim54-domain-containing protein [Dimargaris cristalligena]|uniref:Mitochondrial import inner membrane translocase subunit TIM54 n=1 Tax=Dimargaris cristalligena TaxID=215637 RepID=A0A4P9ZQT7_9FUNG|nr:inner membrane protein import complex subunit Tim54-domain-containing protein [Dimargaris cristalligena]|eukprot:RKP35737.1 inner membrane protein import complex subunit Tim54-domain-containing protein [Dimargaris cristalligena]